MKQKLLLLLSIILLVAKANSQLFSLSDTTIIFKNQEGKVLTKDEVKEFMKGVFSIRQQNIDGKKIVTIIPTGNDERALQQVKIDAFKNGLIGQPLKSFHLTDLNNKKWDSKDLK